MIIIPILIVFIPFIFSLPTVKPFLILQCPAYYKKGAKIASGGLGLIFQLDCSAAPAAEIAGEFALKFNKPKCTRYMKKTIDIMSSTDHPHILKGICVMNDEEEGQGVVMPFYKSDLKSSKGTHSMAQLKKFSAQILLAIEYFHIHARQIHFDIKPSNILCDGESIVLADFDIVQSKDEVKLKPMGTEAYMAPEVRECKNIGQRCDELKIGALDWFSYGACLYYMFSRDILDGNYEWVHRMRKRQFPRYFTEDLISLLKLLLADDPRERDFDFNVGILKNHSFFRGITWTEIEQSDERLLSSSSAVFLLSSCLKLIFALLILFL